MKKSILSIAVLTVFAFANASSAAVVVQYAPGAPNGSGELVATDSDAGVAVTNLRQIGGLTLDSATNFDWSGWDSASTSFDQAVAANDAWEWGFTVGAGNMATLERVDVEIFRDVPGPQNYEVRASVNGGAEFSLGAPLGVTTTGGIIDQWLLTGTAGENLIANDVITFRLAGFDSTSGAGRLALDDFGTNGILVEGTIVTAIPEPSSLFALGLLGGVIYHRRRTKQSNS